MPSRLRPALSPQKLALQDTLKPQPVRLHAFFKGMTPDLSPWATDETACDKITNLVYRGEHLATDYGFYQLEPTRLSLGANSSIVYNNVVDGLAYLGIGYNTDQPGGGGSTNYVQPVNGLYKFTLLDATGRVRVSQMAMTANTNTHPGPELEAGQLFEMASTSGLWVGIGFFSYDGTAAPNQVAGDAPIRATNNVAWQAMSYAGGLSGSTAPVTGVSILPSARSIFIFTNDSDSVYLYPVFDSFGSGEDRYMSFASRASQFANFAAAVLALPVLGTVGPTFTAFKARSLCPFDGRCFYLNTTEGSVHYNQRLRWSIIGDPTIVWPSLNIVHANYTANGVGAGWIDLREFSEEGQCVMPIGEDRVAVYFRDGVAFLRRTGVPTAAYARTYISRQRGLLGPNAVCDLGGGVHFGVFNDGWYLLNADGGWQEVGYVGIENVLESLTGVGGKRAAHKWKEWFYTDLNPGALQLIQCIYDSFLKQVRIIWPSRGSLVPNRCATYDPQNDRLTTFDYSNVNGVNRTPNCVGRTDLAIGGGFSWDTYPPAGTATWDVNGNTTWDSDVKHAQELGWAHGTVDGYVFQHDPFVTTYDGQLINWFASTLPTSYGIPDKLHAVDRAWVEYTRRDPTGVSVMVVGWDGAGNEVSGGGAWNLGKGETGEPQVDHADVRVPGHNHQLSVSGTGDVRVRSMTLDVVADIGVANRSEGT